MKLRSSLVLLFVLGALVLTAGVGLLVDWIHARAPVADLHRTILLAGLAIVALAALVGIWVARRIARPIEQWADVADRIGLGERDLAFPPAGHSEELRRLSAALHSMSVRLAAKEDDLQERVAERTAALVDATNELERERERLAYALEGSRLTLWEFDLEAGIIHLSVEWSRMIGAPEAEMNPTTTEMLERVPEEDHAVISEAIFAVLKGERDQYDIDHRVRHAQGHWIWIRSRGRVTRRTAEGKALRMSGTNVDVTERRKSVERLHASEASLKLLLDGVATSICHMDLSGRLLYGNRRYHELYGAEPGTLHGLDLATFAGPGALEAYRKALLELREGHEVRYEREAEIRGRRMNIEVGLVPHWADDGSVDSVYGIVHDVSEYREAQARLEEQALTDPVTGLPNSRLFADRLERSLAQARRNGEGRAVLFVDMDGFKSVNDRFGHPAGDAVLRNAGRRLSRCLRQADTLARVGGDEFAVLLESMRSEQDIENVAGKLVDALRPAFGLPGGEASVSCSVGIALFPVDGTDAQTLIERADRAMYSAKREGKGRVARWSGDA